MSTQKTHEEIEIERSLLERNELDDFICKKATRVLFELESQGQNDKTWINHRAVPARMLLSNYLLPSNSGKKQPKTINEEKENRINTKPYGAYYNGAYLPPRNTYWDKVNLVIHDELGKNNSTTYFINKYNTLATLFGSSLPDVFSELTDNWKKEKYSLIVSSLVTSVVNLVLKFGIHWPLQTIQTLFQAISCLSFVVDACYQKASSKDKEKSLEYKAFWWFLTSIAWLATTPLHVFSVLANSMQYLRYIIDAAVTIVRLVINTLLDGLIGFVFLYIPSNKENLPSFTKYVSDLASQLKYAVVAFAWNLFKLMPVLAVCAFTYFTGGFALLGLKVPVLSTVMASTSSLASFGAAMSTTISSTMGILTLAGTATALSLASEMISICFIKLKRCLNACGGSRKVASSDAGMFSRSSNDDQRTSRGSRNALGKLPDTIIDVRQSMDF